MNIDEFAAAADTRIERAWKLFTSNSFQFLPVLFGNKLTSSISNKLLNSETVRLSLLSWKLLSPKNVGNH